MCLVISPVPRIYKFCIRSALFPGYFRYCAVSHNNLLYSMRSKPQQVIIFYAVSHNKLLYSMRYKPQQVIIFYSVSHNKLLYSIYSISHSKLLYYMRSATTSYIFYAASPRRNRMLSFYFLDFSLQSTIYVVYQNRR